MTGNPPERMEKNITQNVFSTFSLFQPTVVQPRPAIELIFLPDDSLPVVEDTEDENDCPACD